MLDLKTVLIVSLASAALQAIAWLFVWRAWRHLYELKFLAAGFAAIALGVLLMILRSDQPAGWAVVLHNTTIKLGLVLLAEGLARFLGQPRYSWVGISLLVLQIVIWGFAVTFDPGNLGLRIHSSTVFTVIIMSLMSLALLRDRTQPQLLRWVTTSVLVWYMGASLVHSGLEILEPALPQDITILDNRNSWYLMQGTLFLIAIFACLLFMIGWRLSTELQQKNAALSREVDERRQLEQRLQESLTKEHALLEEQKDLMRLVSHEFRTPLAIIRNSSDMIGLAENKTATEIKDRLAGIKEALDRLFSLIDRFTTEDLEGFEPETVEIGELIAEAQLHFQLTGQAQRLRVQFDEHAPPIHGDPDMMATVIINLIDNALKYSPAPEPVDVIARFEHKAVLIEVRDRGIGIPKSQQHKVGRRFFRGSNTAGVTGTGLGLYASRKLLAYHGGSLDLRSNDGYGTIAAVRVPVEPAGLKAPDAEMTEALQ